MNGSTWVPLFDVNRVLTNATEVVRDTVHTISRIRPRAYRAVTACPVPTARLVILRASPVDNLAGQAHLDRVRGVIHVMRSIGVTVAVLSSAVWMAGGLALPSPQAAAAVPTSVSCTDNDNGYMGYPSPLRRRVPLRRRAQMRASPSRQRPETTSGSTWRRRREASPCSTTSSDPGPSRRAQVPMEAPRRDGALGWFGAVDTPSLGLEWHPYRDLQPLDPAAPTWVRLQTKVGESAKAHLKQEASSACFTFKAAAGAYLFAQRGPIGDHHHTFGCRSVPVGLRAMLHQWNGRVSTYRWRLADPCSLFGSLVRQPGRSGYISKE